MKWIKNDQHCKSLSAKKAARNHWNGDGNNFWGTTWKLYIVSISKVIAQISNELADSFDANTSTHKYYKTMSILSLRGN